MIDTLIRDTYRLAPPAGRLPGTQGHANAIAYIESRFAQIGLETYAGATGYRHSFLLDRPRPTYTHGHNLIGVIPGRNRSLDPILIGAHFDSVIAAPSADDNAAAVAVMLDIAARLVEVPLERDVLIAAFDLEEPPAFHSVDMGSTRFVTEVLQTPVHLAVVMDLIGHPVRMGDPNLMVVTGAESHPDLMGALCSPLLPTAIVRNSRVGDMSDHYGFRLAGFPFLFFSSGEWEHYHREEDTPDLIDYDKAHVLSYQIEGIMRRTDGLTLSKSRFVDISDVEAATLTEHVGDLIGEVAPHEVGNAVRILRGTLAHA